MSLTDTEKEQLKAMIDAGERLSQKYRSALFAEPHEVELIWPGKTVTRKDVLVVRAYVSAAESAPRENPGT